MKTTFFLFLTIIPAVAVAGDEEKRSWTNETELSGVWTSGNTKTSSLGLKNSYGLKSGKNEFTAKLGGVHAKNEDEVIVEQYFLNLKLDRKFSEKTYWYVSTGWKKDEIAGIKNNANLGSGVGRIWVDSEKRKFSTDIGVGYVFRDYVIEGPNFDGSFATGQFGFKHFQKVTDSSEYKQEFALNRDVQGDNGTDIVWAHDFSVAVSKKVALKVGYRLDYISEPAFKDATLTEKFKDLDTTFITSLVINF